MLSHKDITPVIIHYYRGEAVRKCVESLKDCPHIILWDNNSSERHIKLLNDIDTEFDNVEIIYNKENLGWSKPCNQGIIKSKTDWVLLSGDDMIYESDWLDVLNDILEERPHLEQIHLNSFNAMVIHKKTIVRMGWWDERYNNFPTCDDDDWYLRTVEQLGYSPYGTYGQHWDFEKKHPVYFEDELQPLLKHKKEWFNRKDNFTYFCNSEHSKHKVIGLETISGQTLETAGRNLSNKALEARGDEVRHDTTRETGYQFHHRKWEFQWYPDVSKYPKNLLSKDGTFQSRIMGEEELYPDIINEYKLKYGDPKMKPISFIQPSRNNLKYLKWSYNSIRKNLGYVHEICMADDFSNDGTWEWLQEIAEKDKNVKIHRNEGPTRLGHTILYDTLINDYATNDIVMIYHADMYALPGLDEEIDKHIKPGVVVSATRIEPPLHPDGPEKILADYGIEPEEFDEQKLLKDLNKFKHTGKTTEGIFAPWAIYKSDFQKINGHDPLYAPQSKEDSDIFNRFLLAGYEFVQTWEGFVYHMTCRGSRFADGAKRNPDGQVFMKNRETDEWLQQNMRSTRNFIRKWGHFVRHDEYLKPQVAPKYDIGFVVEHCNYELLHALEPWCSNIYVASDLSRASEYIKNEQPNTAFKLSTRVESIMAEPSNDVVVKFDGRKFGQDLHWEIITKLSDILEDSGENDSEMNYDIFNFKIKELKRYEKDLIVCK